MKKTRRQYRLEALKRAENCNRLKTKKDKRKKHKFDLSWFNKTEYEKWSRNFLKNI